MYVNDFDSVFVPTIANVMIELREFSNGRFWNEVPIGSAAVVRLACRHESFELDMAIDEDELDAVDSGDHIGVEEMYRGDSEAEIRGCAYRLLDSVRESVDDFSLLTSV